MKLHIFNNIHRFVGLRILTFYNTPLSVFLLQSH